MQYASYCLQAGMAFSSNCTCSMKFDSSIPCLLQSGLVTVTINSGRCISAVQILAPRFVLVCGMLPGFVVLVWHCLHCLPVHSIRQRKGVWTTGCPAKSRDCGTACSALQPPPVTSWLVCGLSLADWVLMAHHDPLLLITLLFQPAAATTARANPPANTNKASDQ